jgi:hypothetical protein
MSARKIKAWGCKTSHSKPTVSSCQPNLPPQQVFNGIIIIDRNSQMFYLFGDVFTQIRILPQFVGRESTYDIPGLTHKLSKLVIIKEIVL